MKVVDFNNKEYNWPPKNHYINKKKNVSKLHIRVRKFLKNTFPTYHILEEVPIPTSPKLFLDFFIPIVLIAIECQGKQHYEFTKFYHEDTRGYIKYKTNDKIKKEWCNINNILLIELKYNEHEHEWKTKLQHVR